MAKYCESETELSNMLDRIREKGASKEGIVKLVNLRDLDGGKSGGAKPLHRAAQNACPGAMAILLREGADPNGRKTNQATPLASAIMSKAHTGAEIHKRNPPSDQACIACARLLLEHPRFEMAVNDDPDTFSPLWSTVGHAGWEPDSGLPFLQVLIAYGFNPNYVFQGFAALHMAICRDHIKCAHALVQAGADTHVLGKVPPYMEMGDRLFSAVALAKRLHGKAASKNLELAATAAKNVASHVTKEGARGDLAASSDVKEGGASGAVGESGSNRRTQAPTVADEPRLTGNEEKLDAVQQLKQRGNKALAEGDLRGAIAAYSEGLALQEEVAEVEGESEATRGGGSQSHTSAPSSRLPRPAAREPPPAASSWQPSLRALLLSNRCHVLGKIGDEAGALSDAAALVALAPSWFKSHLRHAQALARVEGRCSESLEAFDEALALCAEQAKDTVDAIKEERGRVSRQLRDTGSSAISAEVQFGVLAVPDGMTVTDFAVHAAVLSPARYGAMYCSWMHPSITQ
jgi:hypothetical protein